MYTLSFYPWKHIIKRLEEGAAAMEQGAGATLKREVSHTLQSAA